MRARNVFCVFASAQVFATKMVFASFSIPSTFFALVCLTHGCVSNIDSDYTDRHLYLLFMSNVHIVCVYVLCCVQVFLGRP